MDRPAFRTSNKKLCIIAGAVLLIAAALLTRNTAESAGPVQKPIATYTHGALHLTIPFRDALPGPGNLTIEVLDPDDRILGQTEKHMELAAGSGQWTGQVKLKPIALEDLVWDRVHYRLDYDPGKNSAFEGTESISTILRTPVVHILGQQSYLSGGDAAVRVIVTDSRNEIIHGPGSVRIELLGPSDTRRLLFTGQLNHRGTTEAQFRFPSGVTGSYQLRYAVDTLIGSSEFTQPVRLEDKAAILVTTEKPIYQPGQTIHTRALALDRADHEAVRGRRLVFEMEDSRGNKVFKKVTQTDRFGIASAEFSLAEEVNLGTYHLRTSLGEEEAPTNTAELAINVEKYVLPKFKVAIDFNNGRDRHGYRPGDHVTGIVRANYFFGKPVADGDITIKASGMDVARFDAGSVEGKTNHDGEYRFDLRLANYFAGRPLEHGVAKVLVEASVKDSAAHTETRGEPITVSESPLVITAVPEGGTLVPSLENQVFILTSYPDGTPAKADLKVSFAGRDQQASTDEGGVGVVSVKADANPHSVAIQATDKDGNVAATTVALENRSGEDQILLRTEKAVYRSGDRVRLSVFSTKERGTAYIDIVKDGQTIFTRDVDIDHGRAELSITATPALAGIVDLNAYLFGRDAQPVGDHRLVFVEPADELKIQTVADAVSYKPGDDARVRFRVTNAHGEGVSAALGLQVVDEAVFALAEKQPGFAKVFFYLEQEVMRPRYEIHSIGMPDIVEPAEESKLERKDRAARALFSATELVDGNKFETEFGRSLPNAKYAEYAARYQARFMTQVGRLAKTLTVAYAGKTHRGDLPSLYAELEKQGDADVRDAWGGEIRMEPIPWLPDHKNYFVQNEGTDDQFDDGDDLIAYLEVRTRKIVGRAEPNPDRGSVELNIEHDRGPFNGVAAITGSVTDPSGGG